MDCQKCGHCCRSLILEIQHLDLVREPKLVKHAQQLDKDMFIESEWAKIYTLNTGPKNTCPLLIDDECSIYPTRPNMCVGFEAGSGQCKFSGVEALAKSTDKD